MYSARVVRNATSRAAAGLRAAAGRGLHAAKSAVQFISGVWKSGNQFNERVFVPYIKICTGKTNTSCRFGELTVADGVFGISNTLVVTKADEHTVGRRIIGTDTSPSVYEAALLSVLFDIVNIRFLRNDSLEPPPNRFNELLGEADIAKLVKAVYVCNKVKSGRDMNNALSDFQPLTYPLAAYILYFAYNNPNDELPILRTITDIYMAKLIAADNAPPRKCSKTFSLSESQ